jgi:hypothetical protein
LTLKLLSRVVTDCELAFFAFRSGATPTVEIDRKLNGDMFAPIQGELSELTYRW